MLKVVEKELPFPSKHWLPFDSGSGEGCVSTSTNYQTLKNTIRAGIRTGKSIVVVDDFQYMLASEFMDESEPDVFKKYRSIAKNVWDFVHWLKKGPDHLRVYITWHTEVTDTGHTKLKTVGKMLDNQLTIEGLFTIILKAYSDNEGHWFGTRTNGSDTVKSPIDMFEGGKIENDLKMVDEKICEYYGIE